MHGLAVALIGVAVVLCLIGALGMWAMRDAWQRLHYLALPCSVSGWLIAAAVLVLERQKQSGVKVLLIALVLFAINAVVTQATARAAWVRSDGQWPPKNPPPRPPPGRAT
jgi:monovalent cation/proton antiporter MnhG/PhaG subunit